MGAEMSLSRLAALGFGISYEEFAVTLKSSLMESIRSIDSDEKDKRILFFSEFQKSMHLNCDDMDAFIGQMEISEKKRAKFSTKVQRLRRLQDAISLEDYNYAGYLDHLSTCANCREDIMLETGYLDSGRDEKRIYQGYLSKFFTLKDTHPLRYIRRLETEIQTEFDEYKRKMERKKKTITGSDIITDAKVLNFPQVRTEHIHTGHTSTTITQRIPSDKLHQIQVRVENLMNGNGKLNDGELEDISRRIQSLGDDYPELHSTAQKVLTLVNILLEGRDNSYGDKNMENSISTAPSQGSDMGVGEIIVDYTEVEKALGIIQSFRKHVGVPSSTNHTSSGSVGDGSFWYRAVSPMLDFLGQQIQKGEIDPNNFSWAQLADMHIGNVEIRNLIDDISIFRIQLCQFDENQNLLDNIHSLPKVLVSFRGTGRFRDENCFLTLINLIDTF